MLTAIKNFFKPYSAAALNQEYEAVLREEFERKAFASGDFKGVRFTRRQSGDYADAGLEAAWQDCLEFENWAARQI